jgi:hypothetical protein
MASESPNDPVPSEPVNAKLVALTGLVVLLVAGALFFASRKPITNTLGGSDVYCAGVDGADPLARGAVVACKFNEDCLPDAMNAFCAPARVNARGCVNPDFYCSFANKCVQLCPAT